MRKIQTEVYSRVVGYFRPVDQWNGGKKEEFEQREEINVKNMEVKHGLDH